MDLHIEQFKPYVPARDFELSKRFYAALGFTMSEGWGGTADFALDGHAFRLQDFFVPEWAQNSMILINVACVDDWYRHVPYFGC